MWMEIISRVGDIFGDFQFLPTSLDLTDEKWREYMGIEPTKDV